MKREIVVTGGGSGLGAALALMLAARGQQVHIVGRRGRPLKELELGAPRIRAHQADLSTQAGRASLVEALSAIPHLHLIHNAATIGPIAPLREVKLDEWRDAFAINVEAPLFLTKALLPKLKGGRVLHIGTGAAHKPMHGWGAYCSSKAAFHMLYRVLDAELANVAIGSARPGVVDTPMQEQIRDASPQSFPRVHFFQKLKEEGKLLDPQRVATFLSWLLLDVDEERFSKEEWDVRDEWHQQEWERLGELGVEE